MLKGFGNHALSRTPHYINGEVMTLASASGEETPNPQYLDSIEHTIFELSSILRDPSLVSGRFANLAKGEDEKKTAPSFECLREWHRLQVAASLIVGSVHNLRNNLTSIRGCVSQLKEEITDRPQSEDVNTLLDFVLKDSTAAMDAVNSLLDLAKGEDSVKEEKVLIAPVVVDTLALFRGLVRSVTFCFSCVDSSVAFIGDGRRFKEMLVNLIRNAISACEGVDNPTISIFVESQTFEGGRKALVSVRDNGQGMDEKIISRVSQPFFSTKGRGGSGLGLFMTKVHLRQIGGSLEIESKKNAGSCFTLVIPSK